MMGVEQSVECELVGEKEVLRENLLQYHSITNTPGMEPGPPRWEAGD
jgi:hypothetical protein